MDELLLLVSIATIFISTVFKSIVFYNKNISFFSLLILSVAEVFILAMLVLSGALLFFPIAYFGLMIPSYVLLNLGILHIFSSFIVNMLAFLILFFKLLDIFHIQFRIM